MTAGTARTIEHAATVPASAARPRRRGRTVAIAAGVVVIGGLATRVVAWNRSTTHPVAIDAACRHTGSDAASDDQATTPTRFQPAARSGPPMLSRHASVFAKGSGRLALPEQPFPTDALIREILPESPRSVAPLSGRDACRGSIRVCTVPNLFQTNGGVHTEECRLWGTHARRRKISIDRGSRSGTHVALRGFSRTHGRVAV